MGREFDVGCCGKLGNLWVLNQQGLIVLWRLRSAMSLYTGGLQPDFWWVRRVSKNNAGLGG